MIIRLIQVGDFCDERPGGLVEPIGDTIMEMHVDSILDMRGRAVGPG